ncbi:MAG: Gfo/Idh/MocA family oxidoreductase, partial [Chloroflexota bacterium]
MNKIRTLVIGSGERIQQVILPALFCLRPQFELVGIHSRTQATVEALASDWSGDVICKGSNELGSFDFKQIDLIIIAITKESNPDILQQLINQGAIHIPILMDTPPLHLSGMRKLKLFRRFK